MAKQTWLFNWRQGGYNTVQAETKEEVIEKAKNLARYTILVIDEASIRLPKPGEVEALDRYYAGYFN